MSRRAWWLSVSAVVAIVACGRIGFDAGGTSSARDGAATGDGATGDGATSRDGPSTADAIACTAMQEAACAVAGGTCAANVCTVAPPSGQPVTCPSTGCEVDCSAPGSCAAGVTCPAGTTCNIDCTAPGTCTGGNITCTDATCILHCGDNSCDDLALDCTGGSCALHCCGPSGCNGNVCASCSITGMCP